MSACRYAYKIAFPTEAAARVQLRHLKATSRRNKKLTNKVGVYLCPDGGHWHMGTDRFKRTKLDYPASILPVTNRIITPKS